ncbi:hypothetical protein TUM4630_33600 [Shewanella algidipiscicola]|uniref:Uncharacterized protein n=1 Tax=Shewanella algidipiscicola TaxID=614070 RepID=A0ABQ4NSS3_9GAMM|nr:hypothetical protein TUM4630_33600 [Shewanella algidipiscicola]
MTFHSDSAATLFNFGEFEFEIGDDTRHLLLFGFELIAAGIDSTTQLRHVNVPFVNCDGV